MAKVKVVVELDIPQMTSAELFKHISTSVSRWGGQFNPDHPLFPQNLTKENLTIRYASSEE